MARVDAPEPLPGFSWPVPRAFAAAVSICRFEQGDVFYDAPDAYAAWAEPPKRGRKRAGFGQWVQVLDPPRSARSAPADAEGDRFAANWASPVTVEIGRAGEDGAETARTTQGSLFTCLWRGLPGLLREPDPDLPLPVGGRELQKHLTDAVPALRAALGDGDDPFFAIVVDAASESSLSKARQVEAALAASLEARTVSLSPAEASAPEPDRFHPALRIEAVAVRTDDPDRIGALLKSALYGGSDESAGRFRLDRHGLLVTPGEEPASESDPG